MSQARSRIRAILDDEDPFGRWITFCIYAATVLAAAVFMAETIGPVRNRHGAVLVGIEILLSLFFTAEYLLRIYAAPRPFRYIFSFWGVIDFLSSLPVLLAFSTSAVAFRSLRLFRLTRVLKLLRIDDAYERFLRALTAISKELIVFLGFAAVLLYFASMGIYFFEREAQPEAFSSAPASLWWAVVTLTTVGYGDIYPVTTGGRIFTGFLLLIGLSVVAIPTALFSAALIEARRQMRLDDEAG